ncbi:MAG: BLUF domain-containing protein [Bacteroidota bacterium]
MLFYTIYTSTPSGVLTNETLEKITEESIKWNKPHGITGMLLGLEKKFVQFLEGEEEDVREVFSMIKSDPRHTDISLKIQGYANERVFQDWSMGSWMLSNEKLSQLSGLDDLRNYLQGSSKMNSQATNLINMMSNILKTWLIHEPERAKKLGL